ncbi:hypothetical protein EGR_10764 [Echinococcus granulosus]|uniref:Uncharacterized protein n=1 Tax=Echinococcus granulosus TaxID=6210 RepID=W6U7M8_ECHGR|nr:hypothetical protein EGR_10764 [Echinococcus granulosus]EUB54377.1 hypothetical protein EGR_10764 [Echinococcus granulosus]
MKSLSVFSCGLKYQHMCVPQIILQVNSKFTCNIKQWNKIMHRRFKITLDLELAFLHTPYSAVLTLCEPPTFAALSVLSPNTATLNISIRNTPQNFLSLHFYSTQSSSKCQYLDAVSMGNGWEPYFIIHPNFRKLAQKDKAPLFGAFSYNLMQNSIFYIYLKLIALIWVGYSKNLLFCPYDLIVDETLVIFYSASFFLVGTSVEVLHVVIITFAAFRSKLSASSTKPLKIIANSTAQINSESKTTTATGASQTSAASSAVDKLTATTITATLGHFPTKTTITTDTIETSNERAHNSNYMTEPHLFDIFSHQFLPLKQAQNEQIGPI